MRATEETARVITISGTEDEWDRLMTVIGCMDGTGMSTSEFVVLDSFYKFLKGVV